MKRVALIVLLSIPAAMAVDKDKGHFVPGPASSYAGHQTQEGITIAAVPYVSEEQAKSAFAKVNPYEHGILPVLVIIENGTGKALRMDLKVQLVDPDNHHLDAIPPEDVIYYPGIKKVAPHRTDDLAPDSPAAQAEERTAEHARDREPGAFREAGPGRGNRIRVFLLRGGAPARIEAVSKRPERRLQRQGVFLLRSSARREIAVGQISSAQVQPATHR